MTDAAWEKHWALHTAAKIADWCPTLRNVTVDYYPTRILIQSAIGESCRALVICVNPNGTIGQVRVVGIEERSAELVNSYLLGVMDAINNVSMRRGELAELFANREGGK